MSGGIAATRLESPIGELVITASDAGLTGVYFPTSRHVPPLHEVERGTGGEEYVERGTGGEVMIKRGRP